MHIDAARSIKGKRVRALALGLLLATPVAALAYGVTFDPVARSGDPVPGRESLNVVFNGRAFQSSGNRPGVLSRPSINNAGDVVFRGVSSAPNDFNLNAAIGLYVKRSGWPLERLVDTTADPNTSVPTFPVPGRAAGTRFSDFDPPLINNRGDIVFRAAFVGTESGQGFYATTTTGGPIVKIVDTFDAVPGYPTTLFNRGFFFSFTKPPLAISLNNAGQVVFMGRFQRTGQSSEDTGLYGTTVAGGTPVRLADTTRVVPVANGEVSGATITDLSQTEQAAINDNGIVLFEGTLRYPSTVTRAGIFSVPVDASSPILVRAREFNTVVDTNGTNRTLVTLFGGHDLNNAGQFIFQHAFGSTAGSLNALIKGDLSGAPLTVVVDGAGGIAVPDRTTGTNFSNVFIAAVNEAGEMGFHAWDTSANGRGAYTTDLTRAPLEVLYQNGAVPPGLTAPAAFSTSESASAAINAEGNMALAPPAYDGVSDSVFGLYFYEKCSQTTRRVVDRYTSNLNPPFGLGGTFDGPTCPGAPCERAMTLYSGLDVRHGQYRSINDNDEIAFLTAFSTYDVGVYVAHVMSGGPIDITCPDDATLECPADVSTAATGEATATGCGDIVITYNDVVAPGCGGTTVIERTWTADNGGGSPASCTQTITLIDTTPPTLTCPGDLTVECDADNNAAQFAAWLSGSTATDLCGTPTVTPSTTVLPPGCGSVTVNWTADDGCGNNTACSATFTVEDTTPPALTCPGDLTVECDVVDVPTAFADWLALATATDNCGTPSVTPDVIVPPTYCDSQVVTWTAVDACGNTTACTATFTVEDHTPPVLTCPADQTVQCDGAGNIDELNAWLQSAQATDACGVILDGNFEIIASCNNAVLRNVVTWLATDRCGNTSTCTATFDIVDTTPPVLTCPGDLTVTCDPATNGAAFDAWLASATGSDNCGSPVITNDAGPAPTGCGSTTVAWTATDNCGNAVTCGATFTIMDDTPPVLACPSALTLACGDAGNDAAIDAWLASVTATDACGPVTITHDYAGLTPGCGGTGTATVTWTATDLCANTATCAAVVAVVDDTPPSLTAPAAIVVGIDPGVCTASNVDLGVAAAFDACGTVTVAHDGPPTFPLGDTVVTWTATDACGHTATATQLVTVENLPPIADIVVQQLTDIGSTAQVRLDGSGSSDAEDATMDLHFVWEVDGFTVCDGPGTTCKTHQLGLTYGAHEVLLTVTDRCGATNTTSMVVQIDPAELSVLEISRTNVNFCIRRPRAKIVGQVGLPLGVDYLETDPVAVVDVALAGVPLLPPTTLNFAEIGGADRRWHYANPAPASTPGVRRCDITWKGNSYLYRDASFPIEMQSDSITTTETLLELRLRKKNSLTAPFILDIGGGQALIAFDRNFNVTAATVPYVVEAPGRRVELTLPFPLIATTDFAYSGSLNRVINAAPDLRAALGRYVLTIHFPEELFPLEGSTTPHTVDFNLLVGTQGYPGEVGLAPADLMTNNCRWWSWGSDPDDDSDD